MQYCNSFSSDGCNAQTQALPAQTVSSSAQSHLQSNDSADQSKSTAKCLSAISRDEFEQGLRQCFSSFKHVADPTKGEYIYDVDHPIAGINVRVYSSITSDGSKSCGEDAIRVLPYDTMSKPPLVHKAIWVKRIQTWCKNMKRRCTLAAQTGINTCRSSNRSGAVFGAISVPGMAFRQLIQKRTSFRAQKCTGTRSVDTSIVPST